MIKGAIFDIDGTLLDTMGLWADIGNLYLRKRGVEPEEGLGKYLFTMTLEEGAAYMKERYSLPDTVDEVFKGIIGIADDYYRYEAPLRPGMKELVMEYYSGGKGLVLATTGNRELAEAALNRVGIRQYFSELFTASELGTNKRLPLIYLKCAEALGLLPEEIAVYEDAVHAARTVKSAGFHLVGVFEENSVEDWEEIKSLSDEIIYPGKE